MTATTHPTPATQPVVPNASSNRSGLPSSIQRDAPGVTVQHLHHLANLSHCLAEEALDLDMLLQAIVQQIAGILGDNCAIILIDDDGESLRLAARYHSNPEALDVAPERVGEGVVERVIASGQPLFFPVAPAEPGDRSLILGNTAAGARFRPHSTIVVPLRSRGTTLGTVSVSRDQTPAAYTPDDLVFVQEIADRAALAIENAQLYCRLREINAALAQQVAKRTEANRRLTAELAEHERLEHALREAMGAAERASQAKSEFLSRISHELRTPLNAVLGFAQVLQMDELSADQQVCLNHIINGGRHLLALINEVLDLARIESGRLAVVPEPVNALSVIWEAIATMSPLAAARAISIDSDLAALTGQTISADRQRLKQVLLNLLSNAIKYNRDRGQITVSGRIRGGQLQVLVSDNGIGIPADRLGDLFTPFERLGREYTAIEGSGLGLAVARRLVEAMGGALDASSDERGSTFALTFPLCRDRSADGSAHGPLADRQPQVLLIEDNLASLRLIERLLGPASGVTLLAAIQGQLGIDLARQYQPALILLDVHLPGMLGEEVLQRLQADRETRHIPVVVITADAAPRQIERLSALGARAILAKPLEVPAFLGVVTDLLAHAAEAAD